jgi:hypothetical protein
VRKIQWLSELGRRALGARSRERDKQRTLRHYSAMVDELGQRGSRRSPRCRASGWAVRTACADVDRSAVCPVCGRRVPADADVIAGHPVRVITGHRRSAYAG